MKHDNEKIKLDNRVAGILGKAVRKRDATLRYEVLQRDGFKCVICGISADNAKLQLNHLVKMIDGGQHSLDNTITVCPSCNNVREVKNILALSSKKMERSYHLRRKLNGVMCDTAKSTCIHEKDLQTEGEQTEHVVEQLFKTRDDTLFILSFGKETGIKGHSLRIVSEREAKKWLQQQGNSKALLGLLDKPVTSNFTLRLPLPLKEHLSSIAKSKGVKLHALIVDILQASVAPEVRNQKTELTINKIDNSQLIEGLLDELQKTQKAQIESANRIKQLLRH